MRTAGSHIHLHITPIKGTSARYHPQLVDQQKSATGVISTCDEASGLAVYLRVSGADSIEAGVRQRVLALPAWFINLADALPISPRDYPYHSVQRTVSRPSDSTICLWGSLSYWCPQKTNTGGRKEAAIARDHARCSASTSSLSTISGRSLSHASAPAYSHCATRPSAPVDAL
jgi:hypothetical protein